MTNTNDWVHQTSIGNTNNPPLTKLEYFAAMAIQGLLASNAFLPENSGAENIAKHSTHYAKALINELNKINNG